MYAHANSHATADTLTKGRLTRMKMHKCTCRYTPADPLGSMKRHMQAHTCRYAHAHTCMHTHTRAR